MAWDCVGLKLVHCGIWLGAGSGLWLLLVNRWVLHWTDGLTKETALVGSLLGMVVLGLWAASRGRPLMLGLPLVVLVLLGVGELRRAWLRHSHRAPGPIAMTVEAGESMSTPTTALRRVHYAVERLKLGAHRLRVVQLSDLHITRRLPFDYFDRVLERAMGLKPDLLLLTGDFVSEASELHSLRRLLRRDLRAPLGTFAVLGNHDYWTDADAIREQLQASGIELLGGRCRRVQLADASDVWLCGTEHPWGPRMGSWTPGSDDLVIALSHTPDNIYDLARLGVTAVFSGHTHGGQLRIPWLGSLVVPSVYGRRFDLGHFLVHGTHLFVSAGIGADHPPLRVGCPPEILVVDWIPTTEDKAAR